MKKIIKFSVNMPVTITAEVELVDDDYEVKHVQNASVNVPTVRQLNECLTQEDSDYIIRTLKKAK